MHRINLSLDAETYKSLRIQSISEGTLYPGTTAAQILRINARNYMKEHKEEIDHGFISGFLNGLDKPCRRRKKR